MEEEKLRARRAKKAVQFTNEEVEEFREAFNRYDRDKSKELDMSELQKAMLDLELAPKNREEQQQYAKWLSEVDKDGNGQYGFTEFLHLLKNVREKHEAERELDENKVGEDLGFSVDEVDEFREVFK